MSTLGHIKEELMFIFIGQRGLEIGKIFFTLIKDDYKGKRYGILDFFSRIFFICETEDQYSEIGMLIEGYIPEENVLLAGELETGGDLWSNIDENEDIFANRIFAPLMFAVDQLDNPKLILFFNLSNGKQAGICDFLLKNFPLVKNNMPIYIIATTSIDEGSGALSIYWSILGLNSIIEGSTTRACILLDYKAIGNSIFLHRIAELSDLEFETYNLVVAKLIYALTAYDRKPYANAVPFCQLIDRLVLFMDMKFIIPFMNMPRRELIEDELFSGYLNELVNDCNLFTIRYDVSKGDRALNDDEQLDNLDIKHQNLAKTSLANAFIAFGKKQDTDYLNLIRNNLPPIVEYLPGKRSFYTYPLGDPYAIFMENNTVIRHYFQDLIEKFEILMSHHSYLHVLEELGITKQSFGNALDRLISLIDGYQECEDLMYDIEEFDYESEIQKYSEESEEAIEEEEIEDSEEKQLSQEQKLEEKREIGAIQKQNSKELEPKMEIMEQEAGEPNIEPANTTGNEQQIQEIQAKIDTIKKEMNVKTDIQKKITTPIGSSSIGSTSTTTVTATSISKPILKPMTSSTSTSTPKPMTSSTSTPKPMTPSTSRPNAADPGSIVALNEESIKNNKNKKVEQRSRILRRKSTSVPVSLIQRSGVNSQQESSQEEGGALKWLERRADKEKAKIKKEKVQIAEQIETFQKQKEEFEESQKQIRLEEKIKQEEEQKITLKKKDELKELAKMFENL